MRAHPSRALPLERFSKGDDADYFAAWIVRRGQSQALAHFHFDGRPHRVHLTIYAGQGVDYGLDVSCQSIGAALALCRALPYRRRAGA